MLQYVNWRMKVQISETRTLVGTFMAYDKHMNLVLDDCEEYRRLRGKKSGEDGEKKRLLGLVLLRGENVISLSADAPPPPAARGSIAAGGPGVGKAAGRGMPVAPLSKAPKGLSGPVRGVGGPSTSTMMPQARITGSAPVSYARGSAMNRPPPPPAQSRLPPPPNSQPPQPPQPPGGFPRPPFPGVPGMPPFGRGGAPPMFMGRGGPPMGFPGGMRPPPPGPPQ